MSLALTEANRFDQIEHYYAIRGHSFLPCDRVFGVVKRTLRKKGKLYTVKQLANVIICSSEKSDYVVEIVDGSIIRDFKNWWSKHYLKTNLSVEGGSLQRSEKVSFQISKYHYFQCSKENPGYVLCSEFIKGFVKHTFPLKLQISNFFPHMPIAPAYYEGLILINIKKQRDLNKCVRYEKKKYIKKSFWEDILKWPTYKPTGNED